MQVRSCNRSLRPDRESLRPHLEEWNADSLFSFSLDDYAASDAVHIEDGKLRNLVRRYLPFPGVPPLMKEMTLTRHPEGLLLTQHFADIEPLSYVLPYQLEAGVAFVRSGLQIFPIEPVFQGKSVQSATPSWLRG